MRKTDIFQYFAFGYNYNILRWMETGTAIHGDKDSCIAKINSFFQFLDKLDLQVTKKAAEPLSKIRDDIATLNTGAECDEENAKKIQDVCERIDATLDAELQLRFAYILVPRRYSLENLLETPSNLLGEGIFELLPEMQRNDFRDACKCLAFHMPTSAAFHIMRATEGALRFYYKARVKRGRIKHLLWGPIIDHLQKRRGTISKSLLDHLDHIRHNFRNPTQHPDAQYQLDEAIDLLGVAIDSINRMIRDIEENAG